MADEPPPPQPHQSVGELAELYLGNILYAIEVAAMTLDSQQQREHAAWYRGLGRLLAEAHGRGKQGAESRK